MSNRQPENRHDPAWVIAFDNYEPSDEGRREAVLALGNGVFVTRACTGGENNHRRREDRSALTTDLNPMKGQSVAEGIHLGAMGGTLDILQRRNLGIAAGADGLHVGPPTCAGCGWAWAIAAANWRWKPPGLRFASARMPAIGQRSGWSSTTTHGCSILATRYAAETDSTLEKISTPSEPNRQSADEARPH